MPTPTFPYPTAAYPFGTDFQCIPDLDLSVILTEPAQVLGQALYCAFTTPASDSGEAGIVWYDATYECADIRELINETLDTTTLSQWQARLAAIAEQDERVASASVSIATTGTPTDPALQITTTVQTALGPFTIVMTTDQVSVQLLSAAQS